MFFNYYKQCPCHENRKVVLEREIETKTTFISFITVSFFNFNTLPSISQLFLNAQARAHIATELVLLPSVQQHGGVAVLSVTFYVLFCVSFGRFLRKYYRFYGRFQFQVCVTCNCVAESLMLCLFGYLFSTVLKSV